ncbi:MAG: PEP-CTERM sorting domain-containing protein [Verrucomicrobia bacterium]|nr:PEP-CTERM sorting domain-containing protein [Verrucomicrobiota bacterium]
MNNRIYKIVLGTFHNDDNVKTMSRKFGILAALTLAVMGVPGAAAQVIYNPVTQFNVSGTNGQLGGSTQTQSGANGWYYEYSASTAGFGGPGTNSGNHTLLTRAYNQSPYQTTAGSDPLYSLWALGDGFNTAYAPMIFNNNAGRLGLAVGGNLPGAAWGDTILTWKAPSAGTVNVSYNVSAINYSGQNTGPVYAQIDLWNGSTVVNKAARQSLAAGNSTTFTATGVNVNAGDEIQFWRNGFATQSAQLLLDGTLTFTAVPEPSTWALLAFSFTTVMVLRRRRSRA